VIHNSGVATAGAPVAVQSLAAQQLQQLGGGKWCTGGRTNLDGKELLGQLACTLLVVGQRETLKGTHARDFIVRFTQFFGIIKY
jgi:hypothetical protein